MFAAETRLHEVRVAEVMRPDKSSNRMRELDLRSKPDGAAQQHAMKVAVAADHGGFEMKRRPLRGALLDGFSK